jgi:hypothetical protein
MENSQIKYQNNTRHFSPNGSFVNIELNVGIIGGHVVVATVCLHSLVWCGL